MTNKDRKLIIDRYIEEGDWHNAIEQASYLSSQDNAFELMAAQKTMPDQAVEKVLGLITHPWEQHKQNAAGFLLEYSRNADPHASSDLLNKIAKLMIMMPEAYSPETEINLQKHPNWNPDDEIKSQQKAAAFWEDYEKNPSASHIALIKSMFTGNLEQIRDHKGHIGNSSELVNLIPDLRFHAEKSRELVLKDDDIEQYDVGGEPYIKVYRGINGNYGKILKETCEHRNDKESKFDIPISYLSSWTLSPEVAENQALCTDDGEPNGYSAVQSAVLPIRDILHSEVHHAVINQNHPRQEDFEIVFAHPSGVLTVDPKKLEFIDDDGLSKNENIIIEEPLNKVSFKKLIPAVTALSMLGAPQTVQPINTPKAAMSDITKIPKAKPPKIDPGMGPIKMIESSGGKNKNYKTTKTGAKAYGNYGLMPEQVLQTIKNHPQLRHEYGNLLKLNYLKDQDKIYHALEAHPGLEHKVINAHWERLGHIFDGNIDKMAYAWNHGVTGTLRTPDHEIRNNVYVKQYHKFRKMLDLGELRNRQHRKPASFHKKESNTDAHHDVQKFVPFTETLEDKSSIDMINKAIKTGNMHNVNHVGHFTRDSFVVGFDRNDSWLIKIEPFGTRPAIKSVKYGLQSVKEVAFYKAAQEVFELGKWTPEAILGETIRNDKPFPTAAIKMFPGQFISAKDQEKKAPGSMEGILEPLRKDGIIHKIAIMYYILGDADGHGGNILTDGTLVRIIDHGSSFADDTFDPGSDDKIYIPYILRRGIVNKRMDKEEKLEAMPKIDNPYVREQLKHWIMNLDASKLNSILEKFSIDPKPTLSRLKLVQKLISDSDRPDLIINELWVVSFHTKLDMENSQ